VTVKKRVVFSSGVISSGDRVICRFSGTFYLPAPGTFDYNKERLEVAAGHRNTLGE
jgi:hypothetical protein